MLNGYNNTDQPFHLLVRSIHSPMDEIQNTAHYLKKKEKDEKKEEIKREMGREMERERG